MTQHTARDSAIGHNLGCGICGHGPTVETTFRGHEGLVVFMRTHKVGGRLCRDCGVSTFRDLTAMTLFRGWWSPISVFVAPVLLAMNLRRRRLVAALPAPVRTSDLVAGNMHPLPPGRPVLARPQPWIGLALVVGLVTFVALQEPGVPREEPGCFRGEHLIECSEPHDARVIAVVGSPYDCPPETEASVEIAGRNYCMVLERT